MLKLLCWVDKTSVQVANMAAPVIDLIARFYIAHIFFMAGLTKIANWQSTIALFTYEYKVPLLSPEIAAYLGTGVELAFPVFIMLGFGGRLMPFILFIYNIITVISYPFLMSAAGSVGLQDHIVWGLILALMFAHGYGKLSLDELLRRWLCKA